MNVTCPRCGREAVAIITEGRMVTHRVPDPHPLADSYGLPNPPRPNCAASSRTPENALKHKLWWVM